MLDALRALFYAALKGLAVSFGKLLSITECQVDELWSFVRKKEAHLSVAEKVLALYDDA